MTAVLKWTPIWHPCGRPVCLSSPCHGPCFFHAPAVSATSI